MSQDTFAQICCTFIDKRYTRWYVDMFKFIANHMDLREMTDDSATQLVTHIISVLENDDQRVQIQYYPHVLWVLRAQNRALTDELDKKISEVLPKYYNNEYMLNTTNNKEQDFPFFLQQYTQQVRTINAEQGKNGVYLGYGVRPIVAIRSILLQSNIKYSAEIMDSIISSAVDTLILSEEGIRTKLDAISLLSYIVVKYPDDYKRNGNVFEQLVEDAKTIETCGHDFLSSNIDSISLKICLQFLFAAMGTDTYTDILELLPYIQNDIPTTISVTSVITEYLESADCVPLSPRIESLLLQNVLQWLLSDHLEIRCNATRILFNLSRNPENGKIINHQLISLVDSDNVYIKNLILCNIYKPEVVTEKNREYIVSKCENDACFVVRMVCGEVKKQYQQSEHTSPTI